MSEQERLANVQERAQVERQTTLGTSVLGLVATAAWPFLPRSFTTNEFAMPAALAILSLFNMLLPKHIADFVTRGRSDET